MFFMVSHCLCKKSEFIRFICFRDVKHPHFQITIGCFNNKIGLIGYVNELVN